MGGNGAGYAMKLANNLTMAAYIQAIGEGLAMGQAHGLDIDRMLEVVGASPLANGIFANKKGNFRGDGGPLTLDIRTLRKDIQSAAAAGTNAGVPMPVASGTLDVLASAVAAGLGGEDIGEIVPFIRNAMVQKY
ncbi:MAG: NAD-binding protein [Beijerinckiaceae bacterium]